MVLSKSKSFLPTFLWFAPPCKDNETVPCRGNAFPGCLRGPQRRAPVDASRQELGTGHPAPLAGAGRGGTTAGGGGGSLATRVFHDAGHTTARPSEFSCAGLLIRNFHRNADHTATRHGQKSMSASTRAHVHLTSEATTMRSLGTITRGLLPNMETAAETHHIQ